jgi:hypothetical protein
MIEMMFWGKVRRMDFLSKRETNDFCARMVLTQSANDDWLQCKIQSLYFL